MARLEGDKGIHLLATILAFIACGCASFIVHRPKPPITTRLILSIVWTMVLCLVFFYGLHELIFNFAYGLNLSVMGSYQTMMRPIFLDNFTGKSDFLNIVFAMSFFGFIGLRRHLKIHIKAWIPFALFLSYWFAIGLPVTVPLFLLHQPLMNSLTNNVLEGAYTIVFSMGFIKSFK